MDTREELRDELIAVLGATRELSPDTDQHLAEAFLRRVDAGARRRATSRPERATSTYAGPLSLSSLAVIAAIEGGVMYFSDELMKGYLGVYSYSSANTPMNTVFIGLWLVQVALTVVLPRVVPSITPYSSHRRQSTFREM